MVKLLLEKGADVLAAFIGWTPLNAASDSNLLSSFYCTFDWFVSTIANIRNMQEPPGGNILSI